MSILLRLNDTILHQIEIKFIDNYKRLPSNNLPAYTTIAVSISLQFMIRN